MLSRSIAGTIEGNKKTSLLIFPYKTWACLAKGTPYRLKPLRLLYRAVFPITFYRRSIGSERPDYLTRYRERLLRKRPKHQTKPYLYPPKIYISLQNGAVKHIDVVSVFH